MYFFGVMKNEMFYGHEYEFKSLDELEKATIDCIDYYNSERILEKTKGLPSILYRQQSSNQLRARQSSPTYGAHLIRQRIFVSLAAKTGTADVRNDFAVPNAVNANIPNRNICFVCWMMCMDEGRPYLVFPFLGRSQK